MNRDGKIKLQVDSGEQFSPEEITSIVLRKLKESSEKHLGKEVTGAVISVPNGFTDSQRQATIDAVFLAGFNNYLLLNETTAAAIAYAYDKKIENTINILVYDLGGYYLNLSIIKIRNGVVEVISARSYPELGGQIYDFRMAEYLLKKIENSSNQNISKSPKVIQTLLVECEKAKRNLSNSLESYHEIDSLFEDDGEEFSFEFNREEFENINDDLFKQTISHVKRMIEDSQLEKKQIDEILLIGGSTRIPKIQLLLLEFFDGKAVNQTMNANETVVYGAAIQAAFLSGHKLKTNNGSKFLDNVNRKFSLKLFDNNDEDLIEFLLKENHSLPLNQTFVLKKNLISTLFRFERNSKYT